MTSIANGGNAHVLVRDDDYRARELQMVFKEPHPRHARLRTIQTLS